MSKRLTIELEEWVYRAIAAGRTSEARLVLRRFCKNQPVVVTLADWGDERAAAGDFDEACRFFRLALLVHDQIWNDEQLTAALFAARRFLEIMTERYPERAPEVFQVTNRVIWRLRKSLRLLDADR